MGPEFPRFGQGAKRQGRALTLGVGAHSPGWEILDLSLLITWLLPFLSHFSAKARGAIRFHFEKFALLTLLYLVYEEPTNHKPFSFVLTYP